jgi:hypothetical protein
MLFSSTTAQAHAFLEHAIPAVVSTVLIKIAPVSRDVGLWRS